MKNEKKNITEEKKSFNFIKVFICTLLIIFSLVGIFFLSTYIRWEAEISDKYEILYTGQDNVKIDKLVDFYGTEISTDLKDNEAIEMYCTSEYGKECITTDYNNVLENNLRKPLVVINIIVLIDLIFIYILIKDSLKGKIRTYIYSGVIILYGLITLCIQVYKVADYYKFIKDNQTIEAKVTNYLRSDNTKSYIPVYKYMVEDTEMMYIAIDSTLNGDFKLEESKLYIEGKDGEVTAKQDIKEYILPSIVSFVTIVVGFVYLTINKRIKKNDDKEMKK